MILCRLIVDDSMFDVECAPYVRFRMDVLRSVALGTESPRLESLAARVCGNGAVTRGPRFEAPAPS